MNENEENIIKILEQSEIEMKFLIKIKKNLEIISSSFNPDILLYLFPLIERLIVELLSIVIDQNIEQKTQGIYRTMTSILAKCKETLVKYLGEEVVSDIESLYNDSESVSLRNNICHTSSLEKVSYVDINKAKKIAIYVTIILEAYYSKMEKTTLNEDIQKIA